MVKQVNAAHILVGSEKDAKNIMARIEKGENFADLAKRFSKCTSKAKGGDLGWFGKGQMVPEFETALSRPAKARWSGRSKPNSVTTLFSLKI